MSLALDALDLKETISFKRKVGLTAAGDPVYGDLSTMRAKIDRGRQRQMNTTGDRLDDTTVLFTTVEVRQSDLIWFPEDDTGSDDKGRRPARAEPLYDLDGVLSHFETTF